MDNRTDGNFKKQPPFNHGSDKQRCEPLTERSRGQNRKTTVSPVDHQGSDAQRNNPSNTSCHSKTLQQREIQFQKDFSYLIQQDRFTKIKESIAIFRSKYNGIQHSIYALSVKNFTKDHKRPLNSSQKNQLLPLIETHCPTSKWLWRNLASPFHAWVETDLFTPDDRLSSKARDIQKKLLGAFLDQILIRFTTTPSLPDLNARCLTTLFNPMAKLVEKGLTLKKEPRLKAAAIILWRHVKIQSESQYYNKQEIANLLWGMAKLVPRGLQLDILGLKETVILLWLCVDTKAQSGKKEDLFNAQETANLVWSIAELTGYGLLDLKNIPNLKKTVSTLLLLMETKLTSITQDPFNVLEAAYMLRSIAKMACSGALLTDASKLNNSVVMLLSFIVKRKDLLLTQTLVNMLWSIEKLESCELLYLANRQKLKDALITFLPIIATKANSTKANSTKANSADSDNSAEKINCFNANEVSKMLPGIAKLAETDLLENALFNSTLTALLTLVTPMKDLFSSHCISKLLWSTTTLAGCKLNPENTQEIKITVVTLLILVKTKAEVKEEKDYLADNIIAYIMHSLAKLMELELLQDAEEVNTLILLLLPHIAKHKSKFSSTNLANLLWAIAKLLDSMRYLINRQAIEKTVVMLLPFMVTKLESKCLSENRDASLLWAIAKLTNKMKNLPLSDIKKLVFALLSHLDDIPIQQLPPQFKANLLWSITTFGELIETQRAVTLSISLANEINKYDEFSKSSIMMTLWGLLVCIGRLSLSGSTDGIDIIKKHVHRLLNYIKDKELNVKYDHIIAIQASIWLGVKHSFSSSYEIISSTSQCYAHHSLRERFPSLEIIEEAILHDLPPADLYLPEHNIVIEIQGPYHYICADFQTKNGSTLLKIALFKALGYHVIEIIVSKDSSKCDILSMQECIDTIQQKIQNAEAVNNRYLPISDSVQESSDNEYFTANENSDYSDDVYWDAIDNHPTETAQKTTAQETTDWQTIVRKKKTSRKRKAKQKFLPH